MSRPRMDRPQVDRPQPDEFADFYATYVNAVPEGDVLTTLAAAPDELEQLLSGIEGVQEGFAYGEGKWSIRELVGHVIDAERMFAYRVLHFARGESAPLPGMDQNDWAAASTAGERELADLLAEFRSVREANVRQFGSLDPNAVARRGVASDCEVTVRALIYIVCGHERHHRSVLRERYLPALR